MLRLFFYKLLRMSWVVRSIFLVQFGLIVTGAAILAAVEKTSIGEATYFAFITGLTIGYGDIVAHTTLGRIVCVLLGFIGISFTGLVVAVAVRALHEAAEETRQPHYEDRQ